MTYLDDTILSIYMAKNKKTPDKKRFPYVWIFIIFIIPILTLFLLPTIYFYTYKDRIFPNVYINKIPVGGLTQELALHKVNTNITNSETLTLTYNEQSFPISLSDLQFSYNIDKTVNEAYSIYRGTEIIDSFFKRLQAPFTPQNITLSYSLDETLLAEHLSVIAGQIAIEPIQPSFEISGNTVSVLPGAPGYNIEPSTIKATIAKSFQQNGPFIISLPVVTEDPSLSENEIVKLQERATTLLNKSINLSHEESIMILKDELLLNLLDANNSYNNQHMSYIIGTIKNEIEKEPQNPVFEYQDGKVEEFIPAIDGIMLDEDEFTKQLSELLLNLENSDKDKAELVIPVLVTKPNIQTGDVNDLGIRELIGKGSSNFAGSIASRVHNIGLGASNFNGVLIPPGEILSFNEIIGDISALTGYKQSYVIRDGKTILGDGGGVCQVSTTLFRAALNAGLPIVERRPHSYRVTYYEQGSPPGLDATIYSPTTDLKIQNDTDHHILVQTLFDKENAQLDFEIYGTSDGRVATVTKPIITSQSPPPEDHYQDDPTLPEGTVKQIDWAAWGAKVQFDYEVTKNGELLHEETFYSNYRPWQAKFLRGTGPSL